LTSFKKVTPEAFAEIKQGLKKLFKISEYSTNDSTVIENFDIVSLGSKFPVTYYKTGTLLIQGDDSLDDFQQSIRFIKYSLENDS